MAVERSLRHSSAVLIFLLLLFLTPSPPSASSPVDSIRGKISGSKGHAEHDAKIREAHKEVKARSFGGSNSMVKFNDENEIKTVFAELRDTKQSTTSLIFGYDNTDPTGCTIKFVSRGQGQIDTIQPQLKDEVIYFIVSRLSFSEHHGIAKAVLVSWVGDAAPSFQKALSSVLMI